MLASPSSFLALTQIYFTFNSFEAVFVRPDSPKSECGNLKASGINTEVCQCFIFKLHLNDVNKTEGYSRLG